MLKVIGLGFPRTGTMSLKLALELLQFGPCYHMIEVFQRPNDVAFWQSALQAQLAGTATTLDWNTVFRDFQSTTDCPACFFWEPLRQLCPNAKYILTVRDPEEWYDSMRTTVFEAMMHPERAPSRQHLAVQQMARELILETMFSGRFLDRTFAIECLQSHNAAVIQNVPEHQLLVLDVADGWNPLCRFLDMDAPDGPFPYVNTRTEFQQRFSAPEQQPGT